MIDGLPPSTKTVLSFLQAGPATQKDLVSKSHFSPRTVRYALSLLDAHNLIAKKLDFKDMRQIVYSVKQP